MIYSRRGHTQTNLLACGGGGEYSGGRVETLCEIYSPGLGWTQEPYTLPRRRYDHTSWTLRGGVIQFTYLLSMVTLVLYTYQGD